MGEISRVAEVYKLPVIDLSRTFDPSIEDHYGSTEIEPSNVGGQYIVDLIRHIVDEYDFEAEESTSKVYYGFKGSFQENENNTEKRWEYLEFLMERNKEL